MNDESTILLLRQAFLLAAWLSVPAIGASLLAGLVTSILQAAMQIQESTLSVVPKVCAAGGALLLCGPWIGHQLAVFTAQLLLAMPGGSP